MKISFYLFAFLIIPVFTGAQQLATWSQFRNFNYTFNPAAVEFGESGDFLGIDIAYRRQWTEFEDAPRTGLVGIQYKNEDSHMVVGGYILNDRFGPTTYTQAQGQYAYQLQFDRRGNHGLSIGIGFSATQFRLDGDKIKVESSNDQLLMDGLQSKVFANATIGGFYYNQISSSRVNRKFLFAGLSVEQAIPSNLNFEGSGQIGGNLKRELHYHATAGMRFYYGGGYDYVEPVVWGKVAFYSKVNVLTGVRMTFDDQRFWGGLAVSSAWEGYFQFGVTLMENWQLGYANSLFLANTFSGSAGVSHEFLLSYKRWL